MKTIIRKVNRVNLAREYYKKADKLINDLSTLADEVLENLPKTKNDKKDILWYRSGINKYGEDLKETVKNFIGLIDKIEKDI